MKHAFVTTLLLWFFSLAYGQNTRQIERTTSSLQPVTVKVQKPANSGQQLTRGTVSTNSLVPVPVPNNKPIVIRKRETSPDAGNTVPMQKPEVK